MGCCPAPGKVVVGADLDFLDLRVALQKSVQRKGVLGLPFLPLSFFRRIDAAEGQPPFVCGPFQRQMGHGFNGGFVHSHPVGFSLRRQQEAKPLIAARHLCLEGFSPCVGAAQEGIPGSAGFIPADENSVVVVCAFIEDPCPDAGFDDPTADPPLQQIGEHPAVVHSCQWKDELRPLFLLRRRRDVAGAFVA